MEAGTSETGWGDLRVIDLSSIHDEDVKAIVAELILRKIAHYIESGKRSMAPTSQKWFIVVDEAWRLLKPSEDGRHRTKLEWLYRVGRNWNVGIVALTQLWSDIGKIASNADLQVHLSIADAETVEQLVEYTGLQKLRQLGPQLPKHAALILNRSTTDDLERLAAATLYQGRAKIWVVAEMFRLYLPSWQVKRVQREIMEEREAVNARLNEISAQVLAGRFSGYEAPQRTVTQPAGIGHVVNRTGLQAQMAEAKTVAAGVSQRAVGLTVRNSIESQVSEDRGIAGIIREDNAPTVTSVPAVPESQESMPGYDPLDAVISALNAKYPGNYRKEEVLAACLLISDGAFDKEAFGVSSVKNLDMSSVMNFVNPSLKAWLVKIGICYPDTVLPKFAFKRLITRLVSLQLNYEIEGVVKLTCPYCFTYPITPSHVCPSNGGGLHE
jgi:phosphopantetheinyl transferase (holo-ACP synthase)